MKTTRGVIPLIAAIVGVAAMSWAFVTGISAALSGGGSGALPYEIVFIVAALVVLAALVLAIVNLVKGNSRALAVSHVENFRFESVFVGVSQVHAQKHRRPITGLCPAST